MNIIEYIMSLLGYEKKKSSKKIVSIVPEGKVDSNATTKPPPRRHQPYPRQFPNPPPPPIPSLRQNRGRKNGK